MKHLLTLTLLLVASIGVIGQNRTIKGDGTKYVLPDSIPSSSGNIFIGNSGTLIVSTPKEPELDTVACYMHLISAEKGVDTQGWQSGYVVLENDLLNSEKNDDGYYYSYYVSWHRNLIPAALGKFSNVFLAPDRKTRISKDDVVLQVVLK